MSESCNLLRTCHRKGDRTNESGEYSGKFTKGTFETLKDGVGAKKLEDLLVYDKEECGGEDEDSAGMIGSCEGVTVCCKEDVGGGRQQ